mmetsp:Transcript_24638/g.49397  ORF Transcript_24638/g.49397 Transcript_24638/m.49397 type:complete len:118 (+) Transcript_24638:805-1158(+)
MHIHLACTSHPPRMHILPILACTSTSHPSTHPLGRSSVPTELHMTVREIYKTCYPGYGAGIGSGAYTPGLQAGGSSTRGSTSGSMLGKGVSTLLKKSGDEEMRKRLDTVHEFLALVG